MAHWLQSLTQQLSPRWILQSNCLLCERPTRQNFGPLLCPRCTQQTHDCQRPQQLYRQPNRLIWGYYQDSLRRLIHQLKYHNRTPIAPLLGQLLAQAWHAQGHLPQATLVPIPLHPDKQAQRGFNQAELIARHFSQVSGMPCRPQLLQRQTDTQAQHSLSRHDRQTNLRHAFCAQPNNMRSSSAKPGPIVIVDDIYTTGSTITAATQALTQAGYSVWGSAIVASDGD